MVTRKIIKTGNSLGVTLPTSIIKSFNLKEGDIALLKVSPQKTSVTYIFTGHPRQLALTIDKKPPKY